MYFLLALVFVLFCSMPVLAQDQPAPGDPQNLLNLMAYVPATDSVAESYISYNDVRAAELSREGVEPYESFAAFLLDESPAAAIWLQSYPLGGYETIPQFAMVAGPKMPEVLGFDFFDVDRSLQFNQPPELGTILQGNFDEELIDAAHTARDYIRLSLGDTGWPLWCGDEACDGNVIDVVNREPANIFGGDLGRKWPLSLNADDNILLSSSVLSQLEAMAAGASEDSLMLDDVPDYRALVNAMAGYSYLRSAYIIPMPLIATGDPLAMPRESRDRTDDGSGLPPYTLLMIADFGTPEGQTALLGLVFLDMESAETAAASIVDIIQTSTSLITEQPWIELLENRNMSIGEPDIIITDDRYVLLLPFDYPAPSNEGDAIGRSERSGGGFRLFFDAFVRRDLGWLSISTGED